MHKDIEVLQKDVQGSLKADARLKGLETRVAEASSSATENQKKFTTKVVARIASLEITILERINSIDLVPRMDWNFSSFKRSNLECITLALLLMKDPRANFSNTLVGSINKGLVTKSDVY